MVLAARPLISELMFEKKSLLAPVRTFEVATIDVLLVGSLLGSVCFVKESACEKLKQLFKKKIVE